MANEAVVYVDGACSGNPGPAGIGIVILYDGKRIEHSEYLGPATNNIAELTAIGRAAEELVELQRTVAIHTDSQYAIGVLSRGWKAKANRQLIEQVKAHLQRLPSVTLHYVPGHAGYAENERADELARAAIRQRVEASSATSSSRTKR